MKGTFFSKPIEWNIETKEESWEQGSAINGTLKVKNTSSENIEIGECGVGLAFADIKKVHSRNENAFKLEQTIPMPFKSLAPSELIEHSFSIKLNSNSPVTDKKSSYYLTYGKNCMENQLQLNVIPKILFQKIIGLMDTFYRFKTKEYKTIKDGVEYKLIPPASREMASVETLQLSFSMENDDLILKFLFQVKKLDTSSVTTKVNKDSLKIESRVLPKQYSLGKDMINQDALLKIIEGVLAEVKMNNIF